MSSIIQYVDERVYTRSAHVSMDPISLDEVRFYIQRINESWEQKDIKKIKEYSIQVVTWLCHGARVPHCDMKFYIKKGNELGDYGNYWPKNLSMNGKQYTTSTARVVVWLEPCHIKKNGEWKQADFYINTLLHEWLHHYCYVLFNGKIDHDLGFQNRLTTLLRMARKGLPKRKNTKRA